MATEQYPLLGQLRLAYARAIAASREAEAAVQDELSMDNPAPVSAAELEYLLTDRRLAHDAELVAGRAFLARLTELEPFCTQCGCSQQDGCWPPCWWISVEPRICSSHQQPAEVGT